MTNKDLQLLEEIVNTDIPNLIPKYMNDMISVVFSPTIEHRLKANVLIEIIAELLYSIRNRML